VQELMTSDEIKFYARAISTKESAIERSFAWSSSIAFLNKKAKASERTTYRKNN